jgi:hypothetical protein
MDTKEPPNPNQNPKIKFIFKYSKIRVRTDEKIERSQAILHGIMAYGIFKFSF